MKRRLTILPTLLLSFSAASADIVLSVAPADDLPAYLSVLSSAWPSLYPKLSSHLQLASSQAPAEYQYLMDTLLSVGAVPTEYDDAWARAFVGRAVELGPTTVVAENIPGAEPTQWAVSSADGTVASVQVDARPTIVVAVNGNYARNAHAALESASTLAEQESSAPGVGEETMDNVDDTSSTSAANGRSAAWALGVAAVGSALVALF
ncbi:hypothetical protein IW150_004996 [Coemansia sp. RSA 2607]|nr:hypothetical protein IW150_004996 [Coemansia sp. RSA 2607]